MVFGKNKKQKGDGRGDSDQSQDSQNIPFKDLVGIKGVRTLETDTREYKERREKYGDDVRPFDPYLSSAELADRDDLIAQKAKETTTAPYDIRKEPSFVQEAEDEMLDLAGSPSSSDDEIVEYQPPQAQMSSEKPASAEEVDPEQIKDVRKPSQYKDEETILKESIEYLIKQHDELVQELNRYQKSKEQVLEEKKDFVAKKEEVEKNLRPVLEEEKKKEGEIRQIEQEEGLLKNETELRKKEQDRWAKEDERQAIEKKKWSMSEDLDTIGKFINDKDEVFATIIQKEEETRQKIQETEREKKRKEVQLRLLQIRKDRERAETEDQRLKSALKETENDLIALADEEEAILAEKKKTEETERHAGSAEEEKASESRRWQLENQLRDVEKRRWQSSDEKQKLVGLVSESEERFKKVKQAEDEAESELKNLS